MFFARRLNMKNIEGPSLSASSTAYCIYSLLGQLAKKKKKKKPRHEPFSLQERHLFFIQRTCDVKLGRKLKPAVHCNGALRGPVLAGLRNAHAHRHTNVYKGSAEELACQFHAGLGGGSLLAGTQRPGVCQTGFLQSVEFWSPDTIAAPSYGNRLNGRSSGD